MGTAALVATRIAKRWCLATLRRAQHAGHSGKALLAAAMASLALVYL